MTQDGWIRAVEILAVLLVLALGGLAIRRFRRTPDLGTPAERATFDTLHTASLAAPPLRDGLTPEGAQRAIRHVRTLLGTPAVALVDGSRLLAWDGVGAHHRHQAHRHACEVIANGRTSVLGAAQIDGDQACDVLECPLRSAVVAPLTSGETVVGALIAYGTAVSAGLLRATGEVAMWVSTQIELAELDRSRTRLMEAEVRALRAQISPHFVYNSLAAIASFVRTDPERARELLLEFADFTRYAFRSGGEFTTLADELRNIERYLVLEQARFGDRLKVRLRVAPEVLPVAVPYLSIQPLVENAVRHGLQAKEGGGQITLGAADSGAEALIWVEDDGVGADPELISRILAGQVKIVAARYDLDDGKVTPAKSATPV